MIVSASEARTAPLLADRGGAKDLRLTLGAFGEQELTAAEPEDAGFVAEAVDPVEEALAKGGGCAASARAT